MSLNLSPTSPMEQIKDEDRDHDQHYEGFNLGLNHHIFSSSSSSSLSSSSCRIIFNSSQDQGGLTMEDYYAHHGRSSYGTKNTVENGLRVRRLWKKEDEGPAERMLVEDNSDGAAAKIEVKKVKVSCCLESDLSSPSIRVCSDCHTTKTPLWRSGPKGPKSLCNACGIRQRKARRAMAAATCSRAGVGSDPPTVAKVKEKMGESGHSSQLKKRCKLAAGGGGGGVGSSTSSGKYISFEDFLISLRNKLSFHRVLPQDEKEAAILLMALSSGLVHG